MFASRGSQLRIYWSQMGQQVLLRKAFLWNHIPSIGHQVDGQIIQEEPEKHPLKPGHLNQTTSVSSPSDDLVLAEVPTFCSKSLVDRAVKSGERCRLNCWKLYGSHEHLVRLLSECAFIQASSNLDTLARIEALQTGIPLYLLRQRIAQQVREISDTVIAAFPQESEIAKAWKDKMKHTHNSHVGFPRLNLQKAGVIGVLYGSSTQPFTTAPVHWCLRDIFSSLFSRNPIIMTPCESAPLSALYLSILLHKAPLLTLDELLVSDKMECNSESVSGCEYAIPLGSLNILHMRDVYLVEASERKNKVKMVEPFTETLRKNLFSSHDLVAHFMVSSFLVCKHTERTLFSTTDGDNSGETLNVGGKSMLFHKSNFFLALPTRLAPPTEAPKSMKSAFEQMTVLLDSQPTQMYLSGGLTKKCAEIKLLDDILAEFFQFRGVSPAVTEFSKDFASAIQYILKQYVWGNSGYPEIRIPVLCVPVSCRELVCDGVIDVLTSIRYCHACDDLSGDESVGRSNTTSGTDKLIYGPLRSPHDVHTIAEYVRVMQQTGPKGKQLLAGRWQLMAGGFPITFPSGSFCAPVCITKSIPFPEDVTAFQREITEIAQSTPEGPVLQLVFLE